MADDCRTAVVAEQFADGETTDRKRLAARNQVRSYDATADLAEIHARDAAFRANEKTVARQITFGAAAVLGYAAWHEDREIFRAAYSQGKAAEACLVRCIFNQPFRRPELDSAWLTWNDGAIIKAAATAYDQRELPSGHLDNRRLAVLGDMIEEAGCTDAEILGHLREAGAVHVRGFCRFVVRKG